MTAIANIREYILKKPEGEPFASSELRQFASTDNIRQILNRLVKSNEIKKVARGIYVKPKIISEMKFYFILFDYITTIKTTILN